MEVKKAYKKAREIKETMAFNLITQQNKTT